MTPFRQRPVDAALAYAARGWPVFPCHSPLAGGCSCADPGCGSPAKHPRIAGGLNAATTDRITIAAWWDRWPAANVAVRTGAISGLVVVDIDPAHGGNESLDAIIAAHGPLPHGRAVRTGSGGAHLYLAHPGHPVRNDNGTRLGAGIDIRGDGGYVIAPPSRHPTGRTYSWVAGATEIPAMPEWLLHTLRAPERPTVPRETTWPAPAGADAWARAALRDELALVSTAPEGRRNHTLNRAAFSLGQIVAAGALDQHDVETGLLDAASAAGLGEREARRTIDSGLRAGFDTPRGPPTPRRTAALDPAVVAAVDRARLPGPPTPAADLEPEVTLP